MLRIFGLQSIYLRWVINICLIYFIVRYTLWGSVSAIVLRSTINTSLLRLISNHHINLLISQISNQFLCDIFKDIFFLETSKYTTFKKLQSPPHSKHWKTELYQGSDNRGEVTLWIWFKSPGFSESLAIYYCNQRVLAIALDLNMAYSVLLSLISFLEAPW